MLLVNRRHLPPRPKDAWRPEPSPCSSDLSAVRAVPLQVRDIIQGDMSILGTLALAFAVPTYLVVLHAHFSIPRNPPSPDGASNPAIVATLALLVLWICLGIALVAAIFDGQFDWVARKRGVQLLLILAAHLAAGFITWFGITRRHHPPASFPWSLRLIAPWAAFVLPPIVLLGSLITLHPPLDLVLPQSVNQAALAATGAISLLSIAALLVESLAKRSRPPPD